MIQVYALKSFDHGVARRRGEIFLLPAVTARKMAAKGLVSVKAPVATDKWQEVVCIASGPSLTVDDVELVRKWRLEGYGRGVIVTNNTFRMASWADALYFMDGEWWQHYGKEAKDGFFGNIIAPRDIVGVEKAHIRSFNSGAGAIILAAQNGAKKIILIGYDAKKSDDGKAHWHEDHPKSMGNAGEVNNWPRKFNDMVSVLDGIDVINASRDTALTAFRRDTLENALGTKIKKTDIVVEGMSGFGDNIHQRAIIRELVKKHNVWLRTPVPSFYYDFDIKFLPPNTTLRTQLKNAAKEQYAHKRAPKNVPQIGVSYPPSAVRKHKSVMKAMAATVGVDATDFSLVVPESWDNGLDLPKDRKIVVFRPLVDRKEWGGNQARNPLKEAYKAIYDKVKASGAFIVSVADLEDGKEWLAQEMPDADLILHKGELSVNQLAHLISKADMVLTSPGLAVVIGQAVGTPVVCVFGGYESGYSFSTGAEKTPTLCIEPKIPCDCFSHRHDCKKEIDMKKAFEQLEVFTKRFL